MGAATCSGTVAMRGYSGRGGPQPSPNWKASGAGSREARPIPGVIGTYREASQENCRKSWQARRRLAVSTF